MSAKKRILKHDNQDAPDAKSPSAQSPSPVTPRPDVDQNLLDLDDIEILKIMVREYKAHRVDFSILPRRPRFKYPRVNSGITCNAEIRRRALIKAKADPDATGGSLSSLIELLLWKFLGCPSDVVEIGPKK